MKKKYIFLLICVFIVILSACNNTVEVKDEKEEGKGEEHADSITITDSTGEDITVEIPIKRAVVINRNTVEALKVLGVTEPIIATGDNTNKLNGYLAMDGLPDVGKTNEINIESILALKPEVVFTFTNRPDQTLESHLEPAGIKVIRINNYLPDSMDEELLTLAKLFGKEERAEEFLEWKNHIEDTLAERVEKIPQDEKKSVLALSAGALNTDGKYNIFPSSTTEGSPGVGEGYATILAGGIDPASDIQWNDTETSTTVNVDEEYVLQLNPDVITLHGSFVGGYDAEDATSYTDVIQNIVSTTAISQMTAGQNKEVYMFYTNFIGSDKGYIGRLQLAKYLYPDRFTDIEPQTYVNEYFEKWLGVEAKGIWYYGGNG